MPARIDVEIDQVNVPHDPSATDIRQRVGHSYGDCYDRGDRVLTEQSLVRVGGRRMMRVMFACIQSFVCQDRVGPLCLNPVIAHHASIFVFEVMAVIDIHTGIITEGYQYLHPFAGHHQEGILPAFVNVSVLHLFPTGP